MDVTRNWIIELNFTLSVSCYFAYVLYLFTLFTLITIVFISKIYFIKKNIAIWL